MKKLRVVIDPARCIGSGGCVSLAPRWFSLAEGKKACVRTSDEGKKPAGYLHSLSADEASEVREAAMFCPPEAIAVWDEDTGEQLFP